jgi:hypothetical protein
MKFNTSENTILVTLYSACLRYNRLLLKWMFVPCQKILSACGSKLWFLIHSKLLWFSDLVILPLYSGLPRGDQVCGPHSSVVLQVNMFSIIISCRSMLTLFYICWLSRIWFLLLLRKGKEKLWYQPTLRRRHWLWRYCMSFLQIWCWLWVLTDSLNIV